MSTLWIRRAEEMALWGMVLALPLGNLPKRFALPLLGQNLSKSLLIFGVVLILLECFRSRELFRRIPHRRFLLDAGLWMGICVFAGALCFPYSDLPGTGGVAGVLAGAFKKCWGMFRGFFLPLLGTYLLVFRLYGDDWRRGMRRLCQTAVILSAAAVLYSLPEIWWLWTGSVDCEAWLIAANACLYDPLTSHGWWPPLLWKGQLRSLFVEPSYFAIAAAFLMPFLWYRCGRERAWPAWVLAAVMTLMVFMTNARTAVLLYVGEYLLFGIGCLVFGIRGKGKLVLGLLAVTAMAFAVNLWAGPYFAQSRTAAAASQAAGGPAAEARTTGGTGPMKTYIDKNVASVVGTGVRSNTARYGNTAAAIYTGLDHPVFGVGWGYHDLYIRDYLPAWAKESNEVRTWIRMAEAEKGLRGSVPVLNQYAYVLAWSGVPGLVLFLLPVGYAGYRVWKRRALLRDLAFLCLVTAVLGQLAAMCSNRYFYCYPVVLSLLLCAVEPVSDAERSLRDEGSADT